MVGAGPAALAISAELAELTKTALFGVSLDLTKAFDVLDHNMVQALAEEAMMPDKREGPVDGRL